MLFPQVSDIGSVLRISRVRENVENSESQVADKWWPPNLEIRSIADTLPSENPDVRKCYTIPVILVGCFSNLFSFQSILWSYQNVRYWGNEGYAFLSNVIFSYLLFPSQSQMLGPLRLHDQNHSYTESIKSVGWHQYCLDP
jgi:hypothetical protein